ncbi:hypothetical protein, partial [Micromonospora chalcea]|uniref:hypothetical protein n=1 Tax=Micromonospora chalcea TaxID=1874 RepID=UPI00331E73DE
PNRRRLERYLGAVVSRGERVVIGVCDLDGGGTFGQGGAAGIRRTGARTPATAGVADTGTSRAAASATKDPQVLMTRTLATPTRTGHRLRDSGPGAGATR